MHPRFKYAYSYDGMNRLLKADYSHYASGWQSGAYFDVDTLTYDANGNILSLKRRKDNQALIDDLTYNYSNSNRLQSVADAVNPTPEDWDAEDSQFTYDANGNLKSMSENGAAKIDSIVYDVRNLPVRIYMHNGPAIVYRYNTAGQRIYKKVGNNDAEWYIMDGDRNLALFAEDGSLTYWNIIANGVAGRRKASGAKHFYLKDLLGSIRTVINSQGTVVESHDYYPYGLLMPGRDYQTAERTKESFTGQELDDETRWIFFPARPYHPGLGRWLGVDALEEFTSPYVYVGNDPIRFYDLFGLASSDTVYEDPVPLPPVVVTAERPWWAGIFDAYDASVGGVSWWFFGTTDYHRVLYDADYFGNVALPNFLAGLAPFGGKLKPAGKGLKKLFFKKLFVRKLTGETHHLLSKKILRALSRHPTLAGIYSRSNPRFIYQAATKEAHRGYQMWHRQLDDTVVEWLDRNPTATPKEFERFLQELYQKPDIAKRIPGVNLID